MLSSLVGPLLAEAMARSGITGAGALRLNWRRGSCGGRGLALPGPGEPQGQPRFWLQLSPCTPVRTAVAVIVSRLERRNAARLVSRCKTLAYAGAIQALREARSAGPDDALLLSRDGELCCGSSANLLVRRRGEWFTPPLASGCLPGVM